jgi:hypothetical protein
VRPRSALSHTHTHQWRLFKVNPWCASCSGSGTEMIPGKHSDTRIKPLPLTNGQGRHTTVTPERTLASVGMILELEAAPGLRRWEAQLPLEANWGLLGTPQSPRAPKHTCNTPQSVGWPRGSPTKLPRLHATFNGHSPTDAGIRSGAAHSGYLTTVAVGQRQQLCSGVRM